MFCKVSTLGASVSCRHMHSKYLLLLSSLPCYPSNNIFRWTLFLNFAGVQFSIFSFIISACCKVMRVYAFDSRSSAIVAVNFAGWRKEVSRLSLFSHEILDNHLIFNYWNNHFPQHSAGSCLSEIVVQKPLWVLFSSVCPCLATIVDF